MSLATNTKLTDNTQWGVILAIAGYAVFSGQDAIVKWLVMHDYAIFQILFVRSLTISIITLFIGGKTGVMNVMRSRNKGGLALRAGLLLSAWLCYFNAAKHLTLPDLVTLYYAAPVIVTILSIVVLREKVNAWRWASVIVGFIGVVVAANPGGRAELQWALLVLVAATLWAFATMLVRKIMHAEPTINQMIFTNGGFVLLCGVTMPWWWHQPGLLEFSLMIGLGLISGTGQYLLYESFRHAPASVIAPTEYTALVWSVILGYLVWQDLPTHTGIIGAAMIVASSLIVMLGERKKGAG
ncbi:DMT family transporter [Dongia rigui]|uniref:DMT family transporter n=1 Tax=Dongia rigui TaxID=940149 RepID=A0ABU5E034_9PROT|nr:DMT family transporter [Dongia rigui]MDY0872942.1 DMT family transporter [Dongia rigui]